MAAITAAAVKALREKTSLPLMDCKKALTECDGNEEAAIQWLRERGLKVMGGRTDRETSFGRFGLYAGTDKSVGAIVELKCESDPVAKNDEFIQLANDLAEQLAKGPGASTVEELLAQPSPSKKGQTLGEQRDDLMNKIREVFNVGRLQRIEGATGGYSHNAGTIAGVLTAVKGGNDAVAKDVCMHIAAMRPAALNVEDLDAAEVEKERGILREAALQEGKPENIVDKMVEGRIRSYYAERVLLEQPFVKEPKQTVGQYAKENGMEISQFIHWVLGE
ncbi:MAG TPA: translation elongation factor Ts [Pirellulaceae bacterium]|nr:translation elongation factor Ts [Planctomycetales bacterium]MCB9939180.1 translation elongation factor Ts [Planctomycetaceae bacterium]HRX79801.1 translation elongation factor Ts [Pirellulaceae bacterium]